jgi:hypothetical protein
MDGGSYPVEWTPDAQGKWSYDGALVAVSSRYWPASYSKDGRPSAVSEILVGDRVLAKQEFAADTEAQCKALVEQWVAEQSARVQFV